MTTQVKQIEAKEFEFEPCPGADYDLDYPRITKELNGFAQYGEDVLFYSHIREFSKESLFFLCYYVLGMYPINQPWLVERVKEVELNHDKTLDLWFREAWKSTILTYALPIWKIIHNPEISIGIFSHTRNIAKGFLRRIKFTLEGNGLLQKAFPDIFFEFPQKQSPKWSEADGLLVRRNGVYTESTLEAWGVVDAQPTSKHFDDRVYDDVVTPEGVNTMDQIKKTEERFALSHNLGRHGGSVRVIGTRYHFNDLYGMLIERGGWTERVYPVIDEDGEPVLHTNEELEIKRKDMLRYIYECQMMLNPLAKDDQMLQRAWFEIVDAAPPLEDIVRYWDRAGTDAKKAKPGGSHTAGVKMGVSDRGVYYIPDVERFQASPLGVKQRIKNTVSQDGKYARVGIEQDPGQAGKAEAEDHVRNLAGYVVEVNPVRESKALRARPFSAQAEAGNVKLVRGPWNEAYLQELENFDGSDACVSDQVDASSGAFLLLTNAKRAGTWGRR